MLSQGHQEEQLQFVFLEVSLSTELFWQSGVIAMLGGPMQVTWPVE